MAATWRVILVAAIVAAGVYSAPVAPAQAAPAESAEPTAEARRAGTDSPEPDQDIPQLRAGETLVAAIEPCRDRPIEPPAALADAPPAPAGHIRLLRSRDARLRPASIHPPQPQSPRAPPRA